MVCRSPAGSRTLYSQPISPTARRGVLHFAQPLGCRHGALFAPPRIQSPCHYSAGYAFTRAKPDGGISRDEILAHIREVVAATPLPVNADFLSGFADVLAEVAENVARCVATGVAGLSIEDSTGRKNAGSSPTPDLAPHLEFVDLGGHGYAKVRLSADEMRTEFVCIPRPITRSEKPDGGPIRYRVLHTAALWKSGERPQLKTSVLEGDVGLAI
ncbi:hypothetical protein BH18VER2_BH18VER2_02810 [soil metagenome]